MNSKGFTLVEIIVAVVVIALIATIASFSLISIMGKGDEEALELIEKQLNDAALSYVLSNYFLTECSTVPTAESDCSKYVSVNTLINEGYYEDMDNRCDPTQSILVYKENGTKELKVVEKSGICS